VSRKDSRAPELTPNQAKFAALLGAGEGVTDAAKRIGISRPTATRWKAKPHIQAAIRRESEDVLARFRDRMWATNWKALDAIDTGLNEDARFAALLGVKWVGSRSVMALAGGAMPGAIRKPENEDDRANREPLTVKVERVET